MSIEDRIQCLYQIEGDPLNGLNVILESGGNILESIKKVITNLIEKIKNIFKRKAKENLDMNEKVEVPKEQYSNVKKLIKLAAKVAAVAATGAISLALSIQIMSLVKNKLMKKPSAEDLSALEAAEKAKVERVELDKDLKTTNEILDKTNRELEKVYGEDERSHYAQRESELLKVYREVMSIESEIRKIERSKEAKLSSIEDIAYKRASGHMNYEEMTSLYNKRKYLETMIDNDKIAIKKLEEKLKRYEPATSYERRIHDLNRAHEQRAIHADMLEKERRRLNKLSLELSKKQHEMNATINRAKESKQNIANIKDYNETLTWCIRGLTIVVTLLSTWLFSKPILKVIDKKLS